tara:strand:- start:1438 stop:1869 length:432 start_codon:yes stop_codon:yes gene_type:complete
MIDKKFFKIGANVVAKFREHTFENALDINGKKFKGYSTKYGAAKRANKFKRQASEFAGSTAPVLTSDLLRDWKLLKVTNNGFSFGTKSYGDRVKHLAKMGRVISRDGKELPKPVEKFLMREADKYVQRKLDKSKGGNIDINIT